jgi:hypothetical protein
MSAWIVVEGEADLAVVKTLLPDEIRAVSELIAVGGRSNISSVARTLLVKHKEPVAVVRDSDSLDPSTIREKYTTTEQLMRAVSGGIPFKVILCIPNLEAIFFEAPEILQRIFPKVDLASYVMLYKTQPKETLAYLFTQGAGPSTLTHLLGALTDAEVNRLRATVPIRELITFTREVSGTIEKRSAS